ncbi:MAG: prepilin-type N-terminal cleavage/methylation domain-containing protein [Deltaproteobacteria bacterium]|nr:prepilin-type N-terminal cleavage/methylation domain-containing protein [Deltaproteobacteria bacterium]
MNMVFKSSKIKDFEKGFTLIEILVAVAISGIVMAGIYSAYYSQQRSHEVQEQVVTIHQNLRAAMFFMEREIRMAGLDPDKTGEYSSITITNGDKTGSSSALSFYEDIYNEADDTNEPDGIFQNKEYITYALSDTDLRRTTGKGTSDETVQTIAEDIEFLKLFCLDTTGAVTTDSDDIVSVQIAIIARSESPDPKYTDIQAFIIPYGTSGASKIYTVDGYPKNDSFRRELLTAQIKCRNVGLK